MNGFCNEIYAAGMASGAYIVGSINLSIVACKILGVGDPRLSGSGNAGATNLLRTVGWKIAVPVLLLDLAKAYAVIWATKALGRADIAPAMALPLMLGNVFPLFHRLRGGKGVATAAGAFLAIDPVAFLIGGAVFAAVVAAGRRISLGSMAMIVSYPLTLWVAGGYWVAVATGGAAIAIVAFTHRSNILRLTRGKEPKIWERSGGKTGEKE